ncbi:ATP-binding protein [Pseudonocardia broussonetiae]|uniref:ATP-binding protein n=1 Tax=Pseudonocardia broussonetiae TaxID=2736640 RepID=A0A6M6JFC1_9PSEU|nr:ATP-binding protein [Pseudonocardia broussonetiae]QJY46276.1 ATP-binding protein [Pseudonocardia broussonetiae]
MAEASWRFEPQITAPAGIRRHLTSALNQWGVAPRDRDDVMFVLNELVTNVIEHAGTPGEVHVGHDGEVAVIRVIDFSPDIPRLRLSMSEHEPACGLRLVAALSRNWGYVVLPGGKTVWAEVQARSGEAP